MGEGRGRRQRSRRRRPGCARCVLRQGAARPPPRAAWWGHDHPRPLGGIGRLGDPAGDRRRSVTFRGTDFEAGDDVAGPIVLVCAHGRRDACCARLGLPLFDALNAQLLPTHLWQSSHLGGHRFAPNVVVLPYGIQLGRIPLERAADVVDLVTAGRIPLDLYRGRTIYAPHGAGGRDRSPLAHGCGRDRRPSARRPRRRSRHLRDAGGRPHRSRRAASRAAASRRAAAPSRSPRSNGPPSLESAAGRDVGRRS